MTTYVEVAVNLPQSAPVRLSPAPTNWKARCSRAAWWSCPLATATCRASSGASSNAPRWPRPKPSVAPRSAARPDPGAAPAGRMAVPRDPRPAGGLLRPDAAPRPQPAGRHALSSSAARRCRPRAQPAPARRLHELLARRGELRGRQIDAVLPRMNWRPAAQRMARRGWLAVPPRSAAAHGAGAHGAHRPPGAAAGDDRAGKAGQTRHAGL